MLDMMITVELTCPFCGETATVEAEASRIARWQRGELIQSVFPEWTADQRELLISGSHPACWAEAFGL